jgi:polysaccharide pyruvyl transferase WcaK-like protein
MTNQGRPLRDSGPRAQEQQGTRVLLACDTTSRVNWGGRSASLALQQLLAGFFGGIALLAGDLQLELGLIGSLLPTSIAARLLPRSSRSLLLGAYFQLEAALGMKTDYVEADPVKTADNILRHRNSDPFRGLYNAMEGTDILVIDGDGDLIFRTPPYRIPLFNLALIEVAVRLGKSVHYVNSVFADCPLTGRNQRFLERAVASLAKCDTVALRDPESIRLMQSVAPELHADYVPDSLFAWYGELHDAPASVPGRVDYVIPFQHERPEYFGRIRFDEPYACLSGSSLAGQSQEEAVETYTALALSLQKSIGVNLVLMPTCHGDRFLHEVAARTGLPIVPAQIPIMMGAAILAKARVYVTGRYHPAIMAAMGGTPCVFLGADSHKTTSLQEMLGYEPVRTFAALPSREDCVEIARLAAELLKHPQDLRERIGRAARALCVDVKKLPELISRNSGRRR